VFIGLGREICRARLVFDKVLFALTTAVTKPDKPAAIKDLVMKKGQIRGEEPIAI